MSLLGSFKYHTQALIMSTDADQPNSVIYETWTHSLQNLEIYCTFIGWSLLPPILPPQKKTYQILPENLWQAKTGRGLRTPHEEATLGTIPPLPSLLLVAVNPKLSARLEGGYRDTWSDQNLQSQLGGVEDIDYMMMIFLELIRLHAFFDWGGACTLSKG